MASSHSFCRRRKRRRDKSAERVGKLRGCPERPPGGSTYLKVDVSVGKAGGTAFVQEVDVLDEEAEERDHDLQGRREGGGERASLCLPREAKTKSPLELGPSTGNG